MEGKSMKKQIISGLSMWIFVAAFLSSSTAILETEEFQARILQGGMQYTEGVKKLKITIDSYSTDEEILRLLEIQSRQGYEAFMDAFQALNKGIIIPLGTRGIKITIHGAHSIPTEKGRKILLFTQRQSWDVEMNPRTDSRFTFMVFELNVDSKGKGDGKIYEQASIELTLKRTFEMNGYNSPPKQLWDVRLSK
jgi:hypothetical protein